MSRSLSVTHEPWGEKVLKTAFIEIRAAAAPKTDYYSRIYIIRPYWGTDIYLPYKTFPHPNMH